MTHVFSAFRRYFQRSSESGQSIVLLALGFVALAGFVGITTDISLMFVRYSQLSRAVDSAAIAAANQMRQDRSNASVQLAARQFIEFYGLSPEQVIVDTCLTTNYSADDELCANGNDQAKLVRVRAYFRQPTVFLRLLGVQSFDMWVSATSQTASLDVVIVMDVSESMAGQTTYADWANTEKLSDVSGVLLSKTNYGVIYRPATTDEIINALYPGNTDGDFKTGEVDKLWKTWTTKGAGSPLPGLLTNTQIVVNNYLTYYPKGDPSGLGYDLNGIRSDKTGFKGEKLFRVDYNDMYYKNADGTPATEPRADCRVRFYPGAYRVDPAKSTRMPGEANADGSFTTYNDLLLKAGLTQYDSGGFKAFIPVYNYYGCCNDPDYDPTRPGGFDDLVCQPFKKVRNATFDFLDRIDFLRGDRAAFVTYDRSAFLVNPFRHGLNDKNDKVDTRLPAMLDDKKMAYHTLKNLIGVRAEPYFYNMTDIDPAGSGRTLISQWPNQAVGFKDGASQPINFKLQTYDLKGDSVPEAVNYPVTDNCPFANASLDDNKTLFPGALASISLPRDIDAPSYPVPPAPAPPPNPSKYLEMGYDKKWKDYKTNTFRNAGYGEAVIDYSTGTRVYRNDISYEYWASCRAGNVGAALREANNALLNPSTIRRFGTIWIIILMSDGGAGASDPVRRNGKQLLPAKPYVTPAAAGEYGAFGLCPMGQKDPKTGVIVPGELVLYGNDTQGDMEASAPHCADEDPVSRHSCDFRPLLNLPTHPLVTNFAGDLDPMQDYDYVYKPAGIPDSQILEWNKANNHLYDVDVGTRGVLLHGASSGGCEALYDVEDYARDWADVIASANLLSASGNSQVPTIFTIGFGLKFKNKPAGSVPDVTKELNDPVNLTKAQENVYYLCNLNIDKCLGEQLLRYIADVGDNNRVDNDFYQDLMFEWYDFKDTPGYDPGDSLYFAINGQIGTTANPPSFGARDACQTQVDLAGKAIVPAFNTYKTSASTYLIKGMDIAGKDPTTGKVTTSPDGVYDYLDSDARGASEIASRDAQNTDFGREWGQLRANMSCGNYYYSPTAEELQFVFDDIASRMFTRLSR